jgi:hypothetical protein
LLLLFSTHVFSSIYFLYCAPPPSYSPSIPIFLIFLSSVVFSSQYFCFLYPVSCFPLLVFILFLLSVAFTCYYFYSPCSPSKY